MESGWIALLVSCIALLSNRMFVRLSATCTLLLLTQALNHIQINILPNFLRKSHSELCKPQATRILSNGCNNCVGNCCILNLLPMYFNLPAIDANHKRDIILLL